MAQKKFQWISPQKEISGYQSCKRTEVNKTRYTAVALLYFWLFISVLWQIVSPGNVWHLPNTLDILKLKLDFARPEDNCHMKCLVFLRIFKWCRVTYNNYYTCSLLRVKEKFSIWEGKICKRRVIIMPHSGTDRWAIKILHVHCITLSLCQQLAMNLSPRLPYLGIHKDRIWPIYISQ